jgi:hypothetical protein
VNLGFGVGSKQFIHLQCSSFLKKIVKQKNGLSLISKFPHMRLLLSLLSLVTIISCGKENNNKIQQIEGLYWDSLTYTKPNTILNNTGPFLTIDTVIQKRIYKINDSTYQMGGIYNLDTNLVPENTLLLFPIKFVIRPDNTIIVYPNSIDPYTGIIYGSLNGAYYDPKQQSINNIHRQSALILPFYEIHKLKKIEQ